MKMLIKFSGYSLFGLGLLSCGFTPHLSAAINDSGYLRMTGTSPNISYSGSSTPVFHWDPVRRHFQAGQNLPGSGSVGNYSMAFGNALTASGTNSFAFGSGSLATSNFSIVMGGVNTASGTGSIALGYMNNSTGSRTVALGYGNSANGYGSGAFGRSSSVNLSSSSSTAFALGYGLTVRRQDAFVVGRFNQRASTTATANDFRFVVGIGANANNREDAFWIDPDGNVYAKGQFFANEGTTLIGGGGASLYSPGEKTIGTTDNNPLKIHTYGQERMHITSGGSVKIGAGPPMGTYKLQVDGTLFSNGITANGSIYGYGLNSAGYIMASGTSPGATYNASSASRFLWDPDKRHFQAGTNLPGKNFVGNHSMAFGGGLTASGHHSLAFGSGSLAGEDYTLVFGGVNSATEVGAIAMGYYNLSTGKRTVALGYNNSANGFGSGAFGHSSSVSLGDNDATAFAVGYGITVAVPDAFVVGRYNDKGSDDIDNVAFVVGTGTGGGDTPRKDGLVLDKDGNLWVAGTISMEPQGDIPMGIFASQ